MKSFSGLFQEIDQTNSTNEKVHLMEIFFEKETAETAAWALYLLMGRRPKKLISSDKLRQWLEEISDLPKWLLEESYSAVGDTAEMIALIMGQTSSRSTATADGLRDRPLGSWMTELILPLINANDNVKKKTVINWWRHLNTVEIFIVNKFLTGALRVGVSEALVYRALSKILHLPKTAIAARLLGSWEPSAEFYRSLSLEIDENKDTHENREILPKPFCLSATLDGKPADLAQQLRHIPGDWIIDGELVAGSWEKPSLFQELQKRLNRKKPKLLFQKENPVSFIAYDLLVDGKVNLTTQPLLTRLDKLNAKISALPISGSFGVSPKIKVATWAELDLLQKTSRTKSAEGLMVKKNDSIYQSGRKRASLYTDYTFSIWKGDQLVPIAKAYSGLTDAEIRELDQWIRKNTLERFGPVRSLKIEKVFELGFEGLARSARHKSGFAVRFPRILRERTDKKPDSADHVEDMDQILSHIKNLSL